MPTFLCWIDGCHWTKRSFSLVVINPNFDLVRGEGWDALILEDVSGSFWRRDSSLHPARRPEWAERHHVSEAWTALQLLGNRLWRDEMIQRDDSGWLILMLLIPTTYNTHSNAWVTALLMLRVVLFQNLTGTFPFYLLKWFYTEEKLAKEFFNFDIQTINYMGGGGLDDMWQKCVL